MMPQKMLTLDSVMEIENGKVSAALDHELAQAVRDVVDRPADKTKRTVTLVIELAPVLDRDLATLKHIEATFKMFHRTPKRRSVEYPMLATKSGELFFQPHSPFDPRQHELPYQPPADATDQEQIDPVTGEVTEPETE